MQSWPPPCPPLHLWCINLWCMYPWCIYPWCMYPLYMYLWTLILDPDACISISIYFPQQLPLWLLAIGILLALEIRAVALREVEVVLYHLNMPALKLSSGKLVLIHIPGNLVLWHLDSRGYVCLFTSLLSIYFLMPGIAQTLPPSSWQAPPWSSWCRGRRDEGRPSLQCQTPEWGIYRLQ